MSWVCFYQLIHRENTIFAKPMLGIVFSMCTIYNKCTRSANRNESSQGICRHGQYFLLAMCGDSLLSVPLANANTNKICSVRFWSKERNKLFHHTHRVLYIESQFAIYAWYFSICLWLYFFSYWVGTVDAFLIMNLVLHSNSFRHHCTRISHIAHPPPNHHSDKPAKPWTCESTENARNVIVYIRRLWCWFVLWLFCVCVCVYVSCGRDGECRWVRTTQ